MKILTKANEIKRGGIVLIKLKKRTKLLLVYLAFLIK